MGDQMVTFGDTLQGDEHFREEDLELHRHASLWGPPCRRLPAVLHSPPLCPRTPNCAHTLHVLCCCQHWLVPWASQGQPLTLDTLERWVY